MLPNSTTVLIIGAGPAGLACALSLLNQGFQDFLIVDAVPKGENPSRAMCTTSSTLEALDTIDCAEVMIKEGLKSRGWDFYNKFGAWHTNDFSPLLGKTKFPHLLMLPQYKVERILGEKLEDRGVQVSRPYRVSSWKSNALDESVLDVSFESGEIVQTGFIVGADGWESTVRHLAGIPMVEEDGANANSKTYIIIADITFSPLPILPIARDKLTVYVHPHGFLFLMPMLSDENVPETKEPSNGLYHVFATIDADFEEPPPSPTPEYIQRLVNYSLPSALSSDRSFNPNPVCVDHTTRSYSFKLHSGIAERFFARIVCDGARSEDCKTGAGVFLIGDAAHSLATVGAQGMNLGICDGVALGPALAEHITRKEHQNSKDHVDDVLFAGFAKARYERGHAVMRMVGQMMVLCTASGNWVFSWVLGVLASSEIFKRISAMRVVGLETEPSRFFLVGLVYSVVNPIVR